jgi:uncharacterized protein DUF262
VQQDRIGTKRQGSTMNEPHHDLGQLPGRPGEMEAPSVDDTDGGLLKILSVGDIAGDFFVPAYQRGYRWTAHEVGQLLEDIRASNGATYYLQPLVVKARDDGSWELVDGQQRLTTLHLIFLYLARTHLPSAATRYTITYQTREGSKRYLEERDKDCAKSNIDYFHMFRAYRCIEEWFARFGHRTTHEATRLYGYLFESVKVLWYEAPANVDSTDLFTRLNVGRIALTDAELVKALLLSHGQAGMGQTDRALEMAAQWDAIERDLRAPELWSFVSGEAAEEATHISLLLDTLAGGSRGRDRPAFYTFERLQGWIGDDPHEFWAKVVETHSLVLGWYEDRDLFHKVGYLIAVGKTFEQLVMLSKDKGRSTFESVLDEMIGRHLSLTRDALAELTYTSGKTSDVLLLMNVETIRAMQDSSERYSFRAHAAGSWSKEHIHAQHAEPLVTVEQWTEWLRFHRDALIDLPDLDEPERASLIGRIDSLLSTEVTQHSFSALEKDLTAAFSPADDPDGGDMDSIANLALLDHRDNAALNNSVFEVKRRHIIQRDKAGSYIPACTRNVFLKYYTEVGSQQLHFWSATDRKSYLRAIHDAVEPYLDSGDTEA